jgi:hypothetical protein
VAGDARNIDVLTSDAIALEPGNVYRVSLSIGGGGLLGPTVFAVGKVVEAFIERGFDSVEAWTELQYSDLPPDWPRAEDPPGDVFPDWTLRLQGRRTGPAVSYNRDLEDVATGTKLTIRRAWRYDALGAPGPSPAVLPPAPLEKPQAPIWPLIVAALIVAAATVVLAAIAFTPSRKRRPRALPPRREAA